MDASLADLRRRCLLVLAREQSRWADLWAVLVDHPYVREQLRWAIGELDDQAQYAPQLLQRVCEEALLLLSRHAQRLSASDLQSDLQFSNWIKRCTRQACREALLTFPTMDSTEDHCESELARVALSLALDSLADAERAAATLHLRRVPLSEIARMLRLPTPRNQPAARKPLC